MTTIAAVFVRSVAIPLDRPVSFSTRRVTERNYTLVRVVDGDGRQGIGLCHAGHAGGRIVSTAIEELIAPVVVGRDPALVTALWDDVYRHGLLHGRAGVFMRAMSAVDLALWDLDARIAGLPLWKHLGAVTGEPVPAYASGGYYAAGKGIDDLAAEMRGYVAGGFPAVKMKVGGAPLDEDEARVAAVREAVGPDVDIMLDANNAWRDLPTAVRAMRRFEPHRPAWIEEPFLPDDVRNHARLAEETVVPVATGELEAGRWRTSTLLAADAVAVLQTDVAVCGGITEYRRIATIADGHGVVMCPHAMHDIHLHVVASTPNARYVEYFPDDTISNFGRLITSRARLTTEGRLVLPDVAGIGFEFRDDIDRYALEPWRKVGVAGGTDGDWRT